MLISEFCTNSGIRKSELAAAMAISTQRLNWMENKGGFITVAGDCITLHTKTGLERKCLWSDMPGRERYERESQK